MIKKEGLNKPFVPFHYLYLAIFNIIASSAFGKRFVSFLRTLSSTTNPLLSKNRYSFEDEELKFYENSFEYFRANTSALAIVDRVPIAKVFYYKVAKRVGQTLKGLALNVKQKYLDQLKEHQKDEIRNFCDALIEAKEQAICEAKESAPYLNDQNLALAIVNLFLGQSSLIPQ